MTLPNSRESELDRPKAVLAGLLYALGSTVYRTKLVKLTYLLDEANFRLRGQTMTGFAYEWWRYGPNPTDNAVVNCLNEMKEAGAITESERRTPYNNPAFGYRIAEDCDPAGLPLSGDDWVEIHAAVHKYGAMNRNQIVSASKSTAPIRRANQYEPLKFEQDPALTPEEISADPFWQETLEAMRDTSKRISIDELKAKVAQSPQL